MSNRSKNENVSMNERHAANLPAHRVRGEDDVTEVDYQVELGRRQVIRGIEQALLRMSVGGYAKVRISSHLAYGDEGLPGLIPTNALLVVELWVREIVTTR
mgnify:CR=1 FL=1